MKKRFRWRRRKSGNGDGVAANTLKGSQGLRDDCASPYSTILPLPEHLTPERGVQTTVAPLDVASSTAYIRTESPGTAPFIHTASTIPLHVGTSSGANASNRAYWRLAFEKLQDEDLSVADQTAGVQQVAADADNTNLEKVGSDTVCYNSQHTRQEEATHSQYRYEPLLDNSNSFRFASLLPGTYDEMIRVRLEVQVVEPDQKRETIQWEALSWLWGQYGDFRTILVNDQEFEVTRNLFIALIHLRQKETARILWVDALCINQEDLAERSSQISQMAFLFHRAQRVVAWLGEGDPGSQIVMRLAQHLHDFEAGDLRSCDENMMYLLALTFGVPNVKANRSSSLFRYWNIHKFENWAHIDRMSDRELFRRSWVLQEGALATDLIVQCGADTISWNALFYAFSLRYSYDNRTRDSPNINEGWNAMQAIENLRQIVATKQHPPDLLELLWACRNYRSTDPRDRIFALLGVTNLLYGRGPKKQLGFEIDYNKSTEEIFKTFTISMIAQYRDLRVLATKRPNRVFDNNFLGSWCPDWGSLDDGISLLYRERQWSGKMIKYRASGDLLPLLVGDDNDIRWKTVLRQAITMSHLVLQGFVLDTIAAVRHTSHFESDNARLYDWHHWAVWPEEREWVETPLPTASADPQRQDAFWRTVIADADANGNRCPRYLEAQFRVWYQKIIESFNTPNDFVVETSDGGEYKEFLNRMRHVTHGRCLFETQEHGFLGIGDEDYSAELNGTQLRQGDIVAILNGGPLPVLLREASGQLDAEGKQLYKIIGDGFCYVHGVVDGEALYKYRKTAKEFKIC